MTRETMIDAERDYVDERLCGVNDITFEEWESYQDQMLGTIALINTIVDRTRITKTNHRTKTMNGTRTVEVAIATMTFVKVGSVV